jgi:hypothetical protein
MVKVYKFKPGFLSQSFAQMLVFAYAKIAIPEGGKSIRTVARRS